VPALKKVRKAPQEIARPGGEVERSREVRDAVAVVDSRLVTFAVKEHLPHASKLLRYGLGNEGLAGL
jgi:hypothetical protein